ncbi:MAG TPA: hypothetical protein VFS64_07540 [Solirubrobacterales bacterium]|nr:hypothetical protein [Solirubrobacterales bacterium]
MTQRAAARTERARADIEVSRAGIERARKRQEEAVAEQQKAVARQEAISAKLDEQRAESAARWKKEEIAMREASERNEKMFQQIVAELRDQRDERRALIEALLEMIDRLPPPPPHLRSA